MHKMHISGLEFTELIKKNALITGVELDGLSIFKICIFLNISLHHVTAFLMRLFTYLVVLKVTASMQNGTISLTIKISFATVFMFK